MAKVSVVITVYNIDKYISKCLDSIVNQTFKDIEIIVVNDGSTDNSKQIIDGFAGKDSRIKCIHKQNAGVVLARKDGIDLATGEYLLHIDGDDYLELDAIEIAYKSITSSGSDFSVFPFKLVYPHRIELSEPYHRKEYGNLDFLHFLWRGGGYFAPWTYICKRDLYRNIDFDPELHFGEDAYMTSQLVYHSAKIEIIDSKPLLNYLIRDESVSHRPLTAKLAGGMMQYPEKIRDFFKNKAEYNLLEESLVAIKLISYSTLLHRGWFKDAVSRSRETKLILKKYPNLKLLSAVKQYQKLISLYSINYTLGRIFAQYYKVKGKIE